MATADTRTTFYTVLKNMKNNILLDDYLLYIGCGDKILFDFKYFHPFYNIADENHHIYLENFLIPYSDDLEVLLEKLLLKKIIKPNNLKNVNSNFFLKMILSNINLFLQLDKQTDDLVKIAILNDFNMLNYVINQNDEIINFVISNYNGNHYIYENSFIDLFDNQSEELILKIIKKNPWELKHVKCKTAKIYLEAVRNNGLSLEFVENQSDEICLEAVRNNGLSLEFVENQSDEICLEAIKNNPECFKFVKNQTKEICNIAIELNILNIGWIKNKDDEFCNMLLSKYSEIHSIKSFSYYLKSIFLVYIGSDDITTDSYLFTNNHKKKIVVKYLNTYVKNKNISGNKIIIDDKKYNKFSSLLYSHVFESKWSNNDPINYNMFFIIPEKDYEHYNNLSKTMFH